MKTFRLARIAAQAEGALLRRNFQKAVRRAMFAAIAALFGLFLLAALHGLGALALVQYGHVSVLVSLSIVAGIDLLLALVFALLAAADPADQMAEEARAVRDQAMAGVRQSLSLAALLRHVLALLGERGLIRMVVRGLRRGGKA